MSDSEIKINNKPTEFTNTTKILFFDTETSGFIKKDLSSDHPDQSWTVQIGAILTTSEEVISKMNVIIQAGNREINYHAEKIHGISVEKSNTEGIIEHEAAEQFGLLLSQADLIVCHNFDFDWEFIYQLMERSIEELSDEARSAFYLATPSFCTMKDQKVKAYVNAKNKNGALKWPKLIELHEKLFDEGFEDAHDAFADITATAKCFFTLVEREIVVLSLLGENNVTI